MKKILKTLLLISMIVLTGCGAQEEPLISDNNYYINYEMKYFYGEEGDTFIIDLEEDFFEDGILLSSDNKLTTIREKYDSFELFMRLSDNEPYGFDYKIIDDFKAEVTFIPHNRPIICRFINTKENTCSQEILLGYVYIKRKEYIEVNSFEDLLQNNSKRIENKTFVLNKDLDYKDFPDVSRVNWIESCTIINPNNYVIKNLGFKDGIDSIPCPLYDDIRSCYFENLIFENVLFDVDSYGKDDKFYSFAIFGTEAYNSVFKDIKIKNLNVLDTKHSVGKVINMGGLVLESHNVAFINNEINLDIKQTGKKKEDYEYPFSIGGLSAYESKSYFFIQDKFNYLDLKKFPTKYNKIIGRIQGSDVVGGLFGVVNKNNIPNADYNIINVQMSSQTGNVGKIFGLIEDN